MTRFFSEKYSSLVPYVPGEQPQDKKYVKLNTNESPFPPTEPVVKAAAREAARLNLYPAPEPAALCAKFASAVGVLPSQVIATNGSDEILNFAFMAFCDKDHPAVFPDITYGFYEVFAEANGVPYETIPLKEDFSIDPDDYCGVGKTVFIANPNAPTGIALPLADIERIVASNPDNVVVIDEAYIDFGGESACRLVGKYDNLLVTQTFSKSRSMAGARLGFGIACEALISDINTLKYSTNPYNVNRMTQAAGEAVLEEEATVRERCAVIADNREYLAGELRKAGFYVTPSSANFVFARHNEISGERLYLELKSRGVLVRHFTGERIKDFCRITVGSREQINILLEKISEITEVAK
ncbi:MAG: histidinol-phosphate transaminase [Clostridia bacterium]|nr:histidinol-phosphate transaminase [Clostridia bacterium]